MERRIPTVGKIGPICAFILGAVAGIVDAHAQTVDLSLFVRRGEILLSSNWTSTFADSSVQAGPVLLAVLAAVAKAGRWLGISQGWSLSLAVQIVCTVLLALVTGAVLADRRPRMRLAAELLVVVVALATGMVHRSYIDGHPAQILIPLIWIAAGLRARRGRSVSSGLLIGLAAGLETWGLLGAPIVLLARERRKAAQALGVLVAVVGALYLPFVLAGNFQMFDYKWLVAGGSPASLVLSVGHPYTWWMRAVQGAAALGVGTGVAWWLRRSSAALWAIPLAVVVTRLCFEPVLNDWYLIAVETAGLVAAADLCTGRLATIWTSARQPRAG